MAPFGFGRKQGGGPHQPFITDITDTEDLEEIKKIRHMLNPNEEAVIQKLRPLLLLHTLNSGFLGFLSNMTLQ
jgi:hypothetical protein